MSRRSQPSMRRVARIATLAILGMIAAPAAGQSVLYVDSSAVDGSQSGLSWPDAFLDLQDALALAASNGLVSEIWVAESRYTPDRGTGDREASFIMLNGVALYGGFAGGETQRGQRDPVAHPTVLSGDLAGDDLANLGPGVICITTAGLPFDGECAQFDADSNGIIDCADLGTCENSRSVLVAAGTDNTVVLDGFTVTSGNADFAGAPAGTGGAGLRGGSPTVRHCIFEAHFAPGRGGAVRMGATTSIFSDCIFRYSAAVDSGGGMDISSSMGGTPQVRRCTFEYNVAFEGAGMFAQDMDVQIVDSSFRDNRAHSAAGLRLRRGVPTVQGCEFLRNTKANPATGCGSGLALQLEADALVLDCTFVENGGGCGAGAIQVTGTVSSLIQRCRFEGNFANNGGGAIQDDVQDVRLTIVDCDFIENEAMADFADGGAIYLIGAGRHIVRDCRFERNVTGQRGGAIHLWGLRGGSVEIYGCHFLGNASRTSRGGAIWIDGGAGSLCTNSVFVGNQASAGGGAVVGYIDLIGCTFTQNTSVNGGAGAVLHDDEFPKTIANCIFWENYGINGLSQISLAASSGFLDVTHSAVQDDDPDDGSIPFGGAARGNIDDDPLFMRYPDPGTNGWDGLDDDYGDLRLSAGSPCIDAATNGLIPTDGVDLDCDFNTVESLPLDANGMPRFVDDPATPDTGDDGGLGLPVSDMGAYEFGELQGSVVFVDEAATGAGDGTSWPDAYTDLQAALQSATGSTCGALEIWVATGVYTPDPPGSDASATFRLVDNVGLFGGFAGGETELEQRDPSVNLTVLSGDLAGDDLTANGVSLEVIGNNSAQVVTGTGASATAILDGFTVTGGSAFAPASGGGFLSLAGGPTMRNCRLAGNAGACAAGLESSGGILTLDDVVLDAAAGASSAGVANLSRSLVRLDGEWIINDAEADVFGSTFIGGGSLHVGTNGTMRVRGFAPCEAQPMLNAEGIVSPASVFDSASAGPPAAPGVWSVSTNVSDLYLSGSTKTWVIGPAVDAQAALVWTGNLLDEDLSVGGLAEAAFFGGGTLTITGRLFDGPGAGAALLHDGILLIAAVESFHVRETTNASNTLEFVSPVRLIPMGGFLVVNDLASLTALQVAGAQLLEMNFASAVAQLDDFSGTISLSGDSNLTLHPENPTSAVSTFQVPIRGAGRIEIEPNAELVLAGSAMLNLSGLPEGQCRIADEPGALLAGTVAVDGALRVTDTARVENTNIEVNLLDFAGASDIIHNDIRLLEASSGYGGQFFASGNATIACNDIVSEGDRYLDLDPDPADGEAPLLTNNRISVIIREGRAGNQGSLLELRAADYDCSTNGANPTCASGAHAAPGSAGFTADPSDNWVLEKLEVLANAKVNLTNRPGFEFTSNGVPETVYVRELVLHPNAVLNTALQTLYYESLIYVDSNGSPVASNGAMIVDEPLLGFSLTVLEMDDPTPNPFNEFDVRVRRRVRDEVDQQPPPPAFPLQGSVDLLPEARGPGDGVLEMRTRAEGDYQPATSVAASGAFARAGDENITVVFEYRFLEDESGASELIVRLSDTAMPGDSVLDVATITPPAPGRPGAVGSPDFATFFGTFPNGGLNFRRGTYIELELRGGGGQSRVWIDRWDPQVVCGGAVCADLTGEGGVDGRDFLVAVADVGQGLDPLASSDDANRFCLDNTLARDFFVDLSDLLAWDTFLASPYSAGNLCGSSANPGRAGLSPGSDLEISAADTLVLAAKSSLPGLRDDALYALELVGTNAVCVGTNAYAPANGPGSLANGRLIRDRRGNVYQLHALLGVIPVMPGGPQSVVAPPKAFANFEGGADVYVGINDINGEPVGVPLLDAVFDPRPGQDDILYVVPVLVVPDTVNPIAGLCPYRAAAKLQLSGNGDYQLLEIYGQDPAQAVYPGLGSVTTSPLMGCNLVVYEPDVQRLREIEMDELGNLYVLSAQSINSNDWLLIYDADGGNETERLIPLSGLVASPAAMTVSRSAPDTMYLGSSVDSLGEGRTEVLVLAIQRAGILATGVSLTHTLVIDQPLEGSMGFGHVAVTSSIEEHPADGRLLVTGFSMPSFDPDLSPNDPLFEPSSGSILATPTLAVIPFGTMGAVAAQSIQCHNMSLPIGAVFLPYAPGDCDRDGDVDVNDFGAQGCFADCLAGPGTVVSAECVVFDLDDDGDVDLADAAVHAAAIGEGG